MGKRKFEKVVEQLEKSLKVTKRNTWIAIALWWLDKLIILAMFIYFGKFC